MAVEEGSPAFLAAAAAMSAAATAPLDAGIVAEPVYATDATAGHHHHHHHHHRHLLQANIESDNPWLVSHMMHADVHACSSNCSSWATSQATEMISAADIPCVLPHPFIAYAVSWPAGSLACWSPN